MPRDIMGQVNSCFQSKPFLKVQINNKVKYISKKRFKSFKTMDDLIRYLDVVQPMQFYRITSEGREIPTYSPIKIYKEIDIHYTNFFGFHYISIRCFRLYTR